MARTSLFRALGTVLVVLGLAGCGVGGSGGIPVFVPAGPIAIAPFGQGPLDTSATGRLAIAHGTSVSLHVTEDIYTGTYTTATATSPPTSPPASPCITIDPPASTYVFTVGVSAAASCTYPQTADITFTDTFGHTATLYVQGT